MLTLVKHLHVRALIPEDPIEPLQLPVLQRAPWFDMLALDVLLAEHLFKHLA